MSVKGMWKFKLTTRKIHMRISNECFMYLLYIYILTVIRFIYLLLQHQSDVLRMNIHMQRNIIISSFPSKNLDMNQLLN